MEDGRIDHNNMNNSKAQRVSHVKYIKAKLPSFHCQIFENIAHFVLCIGYLYKEVNFKTEYVLYMCILLSGSLSVIYCTAVTTLV